MRKKLIRTLTFVFGLYFVLEFLLPKEIGGQFDKTAFHFPSVLYDASTDEYLLYYVGDYSRRTQAVGLATSDTGAAWKKHEPGPVMGSTLFNSVDRLGFSSLCPLEVGGGYELYYLGHNMETPPRLTVCWATSADGERWTKHGRLEFEGGTPWMQQDELELSALRREPRYGMLQAMAGTVHGDTRVLFIAQTGPEGPTEVLRAEQAGDDAEWRVLADPLPVTGLEPTEKITSLSYVEREGAGELWMYLSSKQVCRVRLGASMPVERILGAPKPAESVAPEDVAPAGEEGAAEVTPGEEETVTGEEGGAVEVTPGEAEETPPGERVPEKAEEEAKTDATAPAPTDETSQPEEPGPFEKISDVCVFADAAGYRLIYSREIKDRVPEDEETPTELYEISSPDGTTWELPPDSAYADGKVSPIIPRGEKAQPTYLSRAFEFMGTFLMVLGAFSVGIGGINMGMMHGRRIVRASKGFVNSIVFFLCFAFMLGGTLWGKPIVDKIKQVESTSGGKEEIKQKTREIEEGYSPARVGLARAYDFVFYNVNAHLGAMLFALVSFYMVGAAFRSFRIKSLEAGFLIVSAVIVLLGQIPIGTQMSLWLPHVFGEPLIPWVTGRLLLVFNAAAYRAVLLGMAIAAISTSMRLWLGLEKGMFHGT